MVQEVVIEADRRAGAGQGERLNKGVGLAQLLSDEGFAYQPTAVRAWMRGETRPPSDVLLALAAKTGISLDERLEVSRAPDDLERQVHHLRDQVEMLQAQMQRMLRRGDVQDRDDAGLLRAVRDGLRAAALELEVPWEEPRTDATEDDLAGILEARMMEVRGVLGLDWTSPATRTSGAIAADLGGQLDEVRRRLAERRERRTGRQRRQVAN